MLATSREILSPLRLYAADRKSEKKEEKGGGGGNEARTFSIYDGAGLLFLAIRRGDTQRSWKGEKKKEKKKKKTKRRRALEGKVGGKDKGGKGEEEGRRGEDSRVLPYCRPAIAASLQLRKGEKRGGGNGESLLFFTDGLMSTRRNLFIDHEFGVEGVLGHLPPGEGERGMASGGRGKKKKKRKGKGEKGERERKKKHKRMEDENSYIAIGGELYGAKKKYDPKIGEARRRKKKKKKQRYLRQYVVFYSLLYRYSNS